MDLFSNPGFMPHIHCYLDRPALVWTMFSTDLLIGIAYVGISLTLWGLIRRIQIPFTVVVLCFGVFILACGFTHFMEVWTLWNPVYWWAASAKVVTAIASVGTFIYLFQLRHAILAVAQAAKLSEQRRLDLEALTDDLEKRVEERTKKLQESEYSFQFILNSIPQLAWMTRNDGYTTWYNQNWYDYTGTSLDQMQGWGWKEVHHPDHFARVEEKWLRCLNAGEPWEDTYPLKSRSGEWRWFLSRARPTKNEQGEILNWFGTNTDVTELRRLREDHKLLAELTKSLLTTEDLEKLLNTIARECLPRLGDWCVIDLVNDQQGSTRVAAAHQDPAKILNILELKKYPLDFEKNDQVWKTLQSGKSVIWNADGIEPFNTNLETLGPYSVLSELSCNALTIYPLMNNGRFLGVISFGMNDRKRIFSHEDISFIGELSFRLALAVDNAQLFNNAQKSVKIRDEFLSIASHELKTPLTGMKIQTQMFNRAIEKGDPSVLTLPKVTKLVEHTNHGLNRLIKLVDDMLDISRIQTGRLSFDLENLDVAEVVGDTLERLQPELIRAGINLKTKLFPGCRVKIDRFRMDQVVTNLLTNAIRYAHHAPLEVELNQMNSRAVLTFQDYGPGIQQLNHERIFLRFERLISANEVSGMGLGLYICRQIMEEHGGSIRVESEEGKGARFVIELPQNP